MYFPIAIDVLDKIVETAGTTALLFNALNPDLVDSEEEEEEDIEDIEEVEDIQIIIIIIETTTEILIIIPTVIHKIIHPITIHMIWIVIHILEVNRLHYIHHLNIRLVNQHRQLITIQQEVKDGVNKEEKEKEEKEEEINNNIDCYSDILTLTISNQLLLYSFVKPKYVLLNHFDVAFTF